MTKILFQYEPKARLVVAGCDLFELGPFADEREAKAAIRILRFGAYIRVPLTILDESVHDKWVPLIRNKFWGHYVGFSFTHAGGEGTVFMEQFDNHKDALSRVEALRTRRPKVINAALTIVDK